MVGKDGEDDIERVIVVGDGLRAAASKTAKIALYPQGRRTAGDAVARVCWGPLRQELEAPKFSAHGARKRPYGACFSPTSTRFH